MSLIGQDGTGKIPALPPIAAQPTAQTAVQSPTLTGPQTVAEPNRLAITPFVDGKIDPEEWDPFYSEGGLVSYLQWEPNKLHLAARAPLGQDIVFSIDGHNDGWLVGSDNVEVRLTMRGGTAVVKCRVLEVAGPLGPHFVDAPDLEGAALVAATSDSVNWTVECTLQDVGTDIFGSGPRKIGARVDAVPADSHTMDQIVPRAETSVSLGFDRTAGLPGGVIWHPELAKTRAITPGSSFKIRHTFKAGPDTKLKRIEIRNEGVIKDASSSIGIPFPDFDRKGRAFVDFNTKIDSATRFGWYVNRAAVTASDGITSLVQTCFRVSPLVNFELAREEAKGMSKSRIQRFAYYIESNTDNRLDGTILINPPAGWRLESGANKSFIIQNSRGTVRRTFEVEMPGNISGAYPVKLTADIGGKMVEQTVWITVLATNK